MYEFENFKGFAQARLNLLRPVTILIGPNGSGKSNAIEAVELLSFIARGGSLHDVTDLGKQTPGLQIRGGLQSCPRSGQDKFSLHFRASAKFDGIATSFRYSVTVDTKKTPRIFSERLALNAQDEEPVVIFETRPATSSSVSADMTVSYNNFAQGGNKPQVAISAQSSALSQYKHFAQNNKKSAACFSFVDTIASHLQASFVFDPAPKLMRGYERVGGRELARDGSNLSSVLYELSKGDKDGKDALFRLQSYIREFPDEPFLEFHFVTTELNDVILGFKVQGQKKPVDARLLSDGTLRSLAVLTALETVADRSRIVIEEFDNGVHPTRVQVLATALYECCQRKKLNVLVTTHNPATMDLLAHEQLDGVVFCSWDSAQNAFRLVELKEIPGNLEFLEQGGLGNLVTRRLVEKRLAPNFEGEQKQKALKWLESLP
jgi:predicted ATPase